MKYQDVAKAAAEWALSKAGCAYSQAKRTQEKVFDCSSLVARAYSAQGKRWKYGGSVPVSCNEVYDDDFELLWPESYAQIGRAMGGGAVIGKAKQPGDLQFLCTDSGTTRANRITHVAMAASSAKIVHARGTKYGVRTDSITLYSGKVCAVMRYNPACELRYGMKGWRTQRLQEALNARGADLTGDGEFGPKTRAAVRAFQAANGLTVDGVAGERTMAALGLTMEAWPVSGAAPQPEKDETAEPSEANTSVVEITGGSVHVRVGPGTRFESVRVAREGDKLEAVETDGWVPVLDRDGSDVLWVSGKYAKTGE